MGVGGGGRRVEKPVRALQPTTEIRLQIGRNQFDKNNCDHEKNMNASAKLE